ncbi:MAG TPA: hypothetical protein VGS41_19565, partial [Chthonomonadales bacterium]|nr:hypothetical protein [Chthonomonadales bacterium]
MGQAHRPPRRHECRSHDKSGTYAPFTWRQWATAVVAPRFIEGAIDRARGRPYSIRLAALVDRGVKYVFWADVFGAGT